MVKGVIMDIVKDIKRLLILIAVTSFVGCGGSPSISVLPSTDSFEQQGNEITAKMDILWVIDNSGSMNNFQEAVEANLLSFMSNFSDKGFDFQIAVTVSDGYRDMDYTDYVVNGGPSFDTSDRSRFKASVDGTRVLSSTEDNAVLLTKFQEIIANVGVSGSGDERVMQSTQAAILNPLNQADGFFRDDAHLAVIFVSDEEDTSWRQENYITSAAGCAGPYTNGFMNAGCAAEVESVSYFENFLIANSSDVYGATVHNMAVIDDGILILDDDGLMVDDCRQAQLPGEPVNYNRYFGERTSALATATGGTISSLCGDFAESLDNIAKKIIETTVEFRLEGVPPKDPSTIQVFVKAPGATEFPTEQVPNSTENGWTYNEIGNSIVFAGDAIPAQGSGILVLYDPDGL